MPPRWQTPAPETVEDSPALIALALAHGPGLDYIGGLDQATTQEALKALPVAELEPFAEAVRRYLGERLTAPLPFPQEEPPVTPWFATGPDGRRHQ